MNPVSARFQLRRPDFSLDVDLSLPARGVTAIFGPSGSGKTTVLRCLAGLEPACTGELRVCGEVWQDDRIFRPPHRRPVGYVFQEASLFPHLDVLGNLRFGLRRQRDASRVALDRAIALLGIAPLLRRRPQALSGGERQRVAIARALAVNPRLLLMDEPLASLDHPLRRDILPYLERVHAELELPLIYVSHSPEEVTRLADHLVVLDHGRVMTCGPLTEQLLRMDLPILLGEDVGCVLEGMVAGIEAPWHLARVAFAGGELWVRHDGQQVGDRVRLRVLARDVSLARTALGSSIQNQLPGQVEAIADDVHPSQVLLRIRVGEARLLARVTRRAMSALGIAEGQAIWVQVKSVALLA